MNGMAAMRERLTITRYASETAGEQVPAGTGKLNTAGDARTLLEVCE